MKAYDEKIPDPKEIEKNISNFLNKKYGGQVKMVSPLVTPDKMPRDDKKEEPTQKKRLVFDLKPKELISYLDQYIIKQDHAKTVLATKICTHFNRIKRYESTPEMIDIIVGGIKNNVLMIGPTGVGKTYMIKLIAQKIGVPFVKGDATKFSETGYVGGDVDDLIRDLVREAGDDIELAQYGIIYIDEIDKIAGSKNIIGADVSRTGVQRALLKPMEETEVELKVPHDPISMFQEIEQFRKTGNRNKRTVNTRNILFIMSGAFNGITEIIDKRTTAQGIGFGTPIRHTKNLEDLLSRVKSEDLIEYGFESEFIGRLPVRAVFERLTEEDLFQILKNPNNPIMLGKKLDFAAYDINIKFSEKAMRKLAIDAYDENTGARGLVSAVESALLEFEKRLPSSRISQFPVTDDVIKEPDGFLKKYLKASEDKWIKSTFKELTREEQRNIRKYLTNNKDNIMDRFNLILTPSRMDMVAYFYSKNIMDVGKVIGRMKHYYDDIKKIELSFFKAHDINIVFEDDAIDFMIRLISDATVSIEDLQEQLSRDFELGFKLIREKTEKNRFFITRKALLDPESYLNDLVKKELTEISED